MMQFVALVRGINVGGHNAIGMADLRDFLKSLGLVSVRSRLQSGNLMFGEKDRPVAALETLLEAEGVKRFERPLTFLVRSADEWRALMAANPFTNEAARAPARLAVMCLRDAPAAKAVAALAATVPGQELVRAIGRELYLVYPNGIGQSRLTHGLIERKLATVGTARNWNTVVKIAEAL